MKKKLSLKIVSVAVAVMLVFSPVKAQAEVDWNVIFLIGTFLPVVYITTYIADKREEARFARLSPKEQFAEIIELAEKAVRHEHEINRKINRERYWLSGFYDERLQLDLEVNAYKIECIRLQRYVRLHWQAQLQNLEEPQQEQKRQELRRNLQEQEQKLQEQRRNLDEQEQKRNLQEQRPYLIPLVNLQELQEQR